MDLSFPGLLIAFLFILPGAIWQKTYGRYFPMRKQDAAELVIAALTYSTIVHVIVMARGFTFLAFFGLTSDFLMSLLSIMPGSIDPRKISFLGAVEIAWIFLVYTLISCLLGYAFACLHAKMISRKEGQRLSPVWLNFLDARSENFLKIKLKDGTTVIGKMAIGPFALEELENENCEFVITDAYVLTHAGAAERIAPAAPGMKDYLLLFKREVVSIALLRKV